MLEAIVKPQRSDAVIGVGIYSLADAGRLTRIPASSLRRWTKGANNFTPLWHSQLESISPESAVGFRDLMEARVVHALRRHGLSFQYIRKAVELGRRRFNDDRPFSTGRFRTDGKRIFWEAAETVKGSDPQLTDVVSDQEVFWRMVERTFIDVDIEEDVAVRWWPLGRAKDVLIDPSRGFGEPLLATYGVPTRALTEALKNEGDHAIVARLFDVPKQAVRNAVRFEEKLAA